MKGTRIKVWGARKCDLDAVAEGLRSTFGQRLEVTHPPRREVFFGDPMWIMHLMVEGERERDVDSD